MWAPRSIDIETPSAARIYDYLLGGSHNFSCDRQVAAAALAAKPDLQAQAFANRDFLARAVRYLTGVGVRQFLDIGSGIPTMGNVHEVARQATPNARVVYVDRDPVAVAHSRAILGEDPGAVVVQEDLRDAQRILDHPLTRTVLNLREPVAVLLVAILHAIDDHDDPYRIVATLRDALAPGSFLVIAHGSADGEQDRAQQLQALSRNTTTPMTLRTWQQVRALFTGWKLVDPGVVWAPQWHPDPETASPSHPQRSGNLVGIACKP
jgi:SAM-dependent methyltransferase